MRATILTQFTIENGKKEKWCWLTRRTDENKIIDISTVSRRIIERKSVKWQQFINSVSRLFISISLLIALWSEHRDNSLFMCRAKLCITIEYNTVCLISSPRRDAREINILLTCALRHSNSTGTIVLHNDEWCRPIVCRVLRRHGNVQKKWLFASSGTALKCALRCSFYCLSLSSNPFRSDFNLFSYVSFQSVFGFLQNWLKSLKRVRCNSTINLKLFFIQFNQQLNDTPSLSLIFPHNVHWSRKRDSFFRFLWWTLDNELKVEVVERNHHQDVIQWVLWMHFTCLVCQLPNRIERCIRSLIRTHQIRVNSFRNNNKARVVKGDSVWRNDDENRRANRLL